MTATTELERQLKPGRVYRREDLELWSKSVDRELAQLVRSGRLRKLRHGLYCRPKTSVFGEVPPDDRALVRAFLKSEDFLLFSPNAYHALGLGTTQLANACVVYNMKRHGRIELAGRVFEFRRRPGYPHRMDPEFLAVEIFNNLDRLAEDRETVEARLKDRVRSFDAGRLLRHARRFGKVRTRRFFEAALAGE
ncbi:MAG: hypothetical protein R3F20_13735 [Planctomycetota bacterium]